MDRDFFVCEDRQQGKGKQEMTMKAKFVFSFAMVLFTACGGQETVKFGTSEEAARPPVADVSQPPPEELQCKVATDCDDGQKNTIDSCVDTKCVHKPVNCEPGFVLDELGVCVKVEQTCDNLDDSNPCTVDSCDPLSGEALHVPKSCDDGNDSTEDACDAENGNCRHTTACGNCADDDPCTDDVCDAGQCVHIAVVCPEAHVCVAGTCEFQCTSNAQCADDDPCTIDSCDADGGGQCVNELRDCGDADKTTTDLCVPEDDGAGKPYICLHAPSECTGGCDDGNACTVDACVDSSCAHFAAPCGVGTVCVDAKCVPAPCGGTPDCDDGNPCTAESCEFGVCEYVAKSCADGNACDAATGDCVALEGPDCPLGCDDGDPATLDLCEAGVCTHHQPIACGAGTALNPKSGECEPAKVDVGCTDGTLSCQQFESLNLLAHAFCAGGHWFIIEGCGAIKSAICLADSGCGGQPIQ